MNLNIIVLWVNIVCLCNKRLHLWKAFVIHNMKLPTIEGILHSKRSNGQQGKDHTEGQEEC